MMTMMVMMMMMTKVKNKRGFKRMERAGHEIYESFNN